MLVTPLIENTKELPMASFHEHIIFELITQYTPVTVYALKGDHSRKLEKRICRQIQYLHADFGIKESRKRRG